MSVYDELGVLPVKSHSGSLAGEIAHPLREVLDRIPHHLYHEDLLIAAWYPEQQRHVLSWDDVALAMAPGTVHIAWAIVAAAGSIEPLRAVELDQYLEDGGVEVDRGLLEDVEGGRVRRADDGGWLAELPGSGTALGVFESITAARLEVERHVEEARRRLRTDMRSHHEPILDRVADARWTRPEIEIWATAEEQERSRPWHSGDLAAALRVHYTQVDAWRADEFLPPPDYPAGSATRVDTWDPLTIIGWARRNEFPCDPSLADRTRRRR